MMTDYFSIQPHAGSSAYMAPSGPFSQSRYPQQPSRSLSGGSQQDAGPMAGIGARRMAERHEALLRRQQQQQQQQQYQQQYQQQCSQHRPQRSSVYQQQNDEPYGHLSEEGDPYGGMRTFDSYDAQQYAGAMRSQSPTQLSPSQHHKSLSRGDDGRWRQQEPGHGRAGSEQQYHPHSHDEYQQRQTMRSTTTSSSGRASQDSGRPSSSQSQQHVLRWDRSRRPTPQSSPQTRVVALPVSSGSAARATVYEDDYEEEPEESLHEQEKRRTGTVRDTTCEALPKATCADCGDRLPFEELVGHVCIRNACCSPLLTIGQTKESPASLAKSPGSDGARSPFFGRYDQTYGSDTSMSPALLSPLPLPQTPASHKDDANSMERKRVIEAQRLAKRQQSSSAATSLQSMSPRPPASSRSHEPPASVSEAQAQPPTPATRSNAMPSAWQPQHRRGVPGSQSSTSTSSSKSSAASSTFARSNGETLTPSSSNELFPFGSAEQPDGTALKLAGMAGTRKGGAGLQTRTSPARTVLDLSDLKGLVDDIQGDQNTGKPVSRRTHNQSTKKITIDTKQALRKPSMPAAQAKLCSVCLKAIGPGQPTVKKDDRIFCIDDYAELYLEKCRKCCQPVRNVGVRSRDGALAGLFHRECFSCLACDAHFDDKTFYVYDNAPYCAQDYHRLNGTLCSGCGHGIEGQCRQLTETSGNGGGGDGIPAKASVGAPSRFHPRCFTCQFDDGREFCKDLLQDYFVVDGKRMCEWHFDKVVRARETGDQLQPAPASHPQQNKHGHSSDMKTKMKKQQQDAVTAAIKAGRRTTFLKTVEPRKVHA